MSKQNDDDDDDDQYIQHTAHLRCKAIPYDKVSCSRTQGYGAKS